MDPSNYKDITISSEVGIAITIRQRNDVVLTTLFVYANLKGFNYSVDILMSF